MTINSLFTPQTRKLFEIFSTGGFELRFVGGCVRNALISQEFTDIDFATTALPSQTIQLLQQAKLRAIPTGIEHGTVTAMFADGTLYEITTLRQDINCFGRKAIVKFGTDWQEDAKRRDFTINAMSVDANGAIFDYFDGQSDLKKRLIKFVGDPEQRIKEDYLRILRYFRFLSYYGHINIDDPALMSIQAQAENIKSLSGERIYSEMKKLLSAPLRIEVLGLMKQVGVFDVLFPLSSYNKLALDKLSDVNFATICASLLGSQDALNKLRNFWKLSNEDTKNIETRIKFLGIDLNEKHIKHIARKFSKQIAFDALYLNASKIPDIDFEKYFQLLEQFEIPTFPINGNHLLELGMISGKNIGNTLKTLEIIWENSNYSLTKEDLIESAKKYCSNLNNKL